MGDLNNRLTSERLDPETLEDFLSAESLHKISKARLDLFKALKANSAELVARQSALEDAVHEILDSKKRIFLSTDPGTKDHSVRYNWLNFRAACWKHFNFDVLGMGNIDTALNEDGKIMTPCEIAFTFIEYITGFLFTGCPASNEEEKKWRKNFVKGNNCLNVKYKII